MGDIKLNRNQIINILIVGLTFGTSWAVRGQFGHEQGAAWAAGIGGLALVLVSQRKDWYKKALSVALASAFGWGMGGMISYGIVVGYGRSTSFPNATYGLLMLFVIGGLYGLIGGGLTGLTLESAPAKKVKWANLLVEMVAGGLIVYGFLIMQLEFLMTPPRSEAWAFCFGAALALIWYMARNGFHSSLRVALFTMLGGGFGFAFGNFLQVVGTVLEINFNMWNVMEYSIGFFGGITLAYSVFTSRWPENVESPKRWENRTAFLVAIIIIPLIVFYESMSYSVLLERLKNSGISESVILLSSTVALLVICAVIIINGVNSERHKYKLDKKDVYMLFISFFVAYVTISFIVSGAFGGHFPLNHILYVVNILVVVVLLHKSQNPFINSLNERNYKQYFTTLGVAIILLIILALVLVNVHAEMGGSHNRFSVR